MKLTPNKWGSGILKGIEEASHVQIFVLGVVLLFLVAVIDVITGDEIHFFLFYYLPVALLAWRVGLRAAVLMAVACGIVWLVADYWTKSQPVLGYELWNSGIRLVSFLILAVTLAHIRRTHDELRSSLARLETSLVEAERMRSEIQTVCAWTNRIKDEGKWISFEEFMAKHYGLRFSHGISEEAKRDFEQQIRDIQQHAAGDKPKG